MSYVQMVITLLVGMRLSNTPSVFDVAIFGDYTIGEQKMADFPKSRLEPASPFSHCAVDYFSQW